MPTKYQELIINFFLVYMKLFKMHFAVKLVGVTLVVVLKVTHFVSFSLMLTFHPKISMILSLQTFFWN